MKLIVLIALFVSGCGNSDVEKQEGQDDVVSIIWNTLYNVDSTPPDIEWKQEVCPIDSSYPVVLFNNLCYYGLFYAAEYKTSVAWNGKFSTSALSHELMHAKQYLNGVRDPVHLIDKDWKLVDLTNTYLNSLGY